MRKSQEIIDVEAAQYIYSKYLKDKKSFKTLIYTPKEKKRDGTHAWSVEPYHKEVMAWLKEVIAKDGIMTTSYRRTGDNDWGRQYLTYGQFGVQRLQQNLRAFLCKMTDFDISNSHYTFLLKLAKFHNLPHTYIEQYCNNPQQQRETVNKEKMDMIAIMYQDKPHNHQNKWLKNLALEIEQVRNHLCDGVFSCFKPSKDSQNPKSSMLSQGLQGMEDCIIQKIIDHFEIENVVKMFDGFMTDKEITEQQINEYLESFEEGQGITIKIKVPDPPKPIIMEDDWEYIDPLQAELDRQEALEDRIKVFNDNNVFIRNTQRYYCMEGQWVGCSTTSFRDLHANLPKVEIEGGKSQSWASWWIENHRNDYQKRDFYPYNPNHSPDPTPPGIFNCFTPFKRIGCEGKVTKLIELFETLCFNLAEANDECFKYLRNWIAHLIQSPGVLAETVCGLYGPGGVGKDTLVTTISRLIDDNEYVKTTGQQSQGLGRFNSMLDGCLVCDFNEGEGKDAVEGLSKLKNNSTAKTLPIERKGVDTEEVRHYTRYLVKSNNPQFIIVEEDDRRMFVVLATKYLSHNWSICPEDCSWGGSKPGSMKKGEKGSQWFFGQYFELLDDEEAVNGLFHYLDNLDLSKFNVRRFPKGQAYNENQAKNYKPHIPWLREFVKRELKSSIDYRVVRKNNTNKRVLFCPKDALFADFNSWCLSKNIQNKSVDSEPKLTRELKIMDSELITNGRTAKPIGGWGRPSCIVLDFERIQGILDQSYPSGVVEETIFDDEVEPWQCDFTNSLDD